MTVRTRFAPSPTGYLHIGGARTALFSWLYARRHGGQFILRIEDTDLERSTPEAVNAILEGMAWLGLDYDEGPFYQTRRFDRYRAVLNDMLAAGTAYRCYCSKERLEELRHAQMAAKEKPRYDGRCREGRPAGGGADAPFTVRFRQPREGVTRVEDQVKGEVLFRNEELDDLILARADGTPTYNFTVVVDDLDMRITHVIRGDDHLNNTPRQVNILRALGARPPVYAHLPMILGPDGAKLSKRHGAVSVMQYRDEGYLPEALLNYLVRLGWSHGDQEVFSLDEMTALFDIRDVNHSASAVNPDKLLWLNQHYLKHADPAHVARHLSWHLGQLGLDPAAGGPAAADVVRAQRERAKTLAEMAASSRFFYATPSEYAPDVLAKHLGADIRPALQALHDALAALEAWGAETIHALLNRMAAQTGLKLGKLAQPLRVAVSGGTVSPPIDQTLALLGREETLARLRRALQAAAA